MSAAAPAPAPTRIFADFEPAHIVCDCAPDWSLCGVEMDPDAECDEGTDIDCGICADLDLLPCPRCGDVEPLGKERAA